MEKLKYKYLKIALFDLHFEIEYQRKVGSYLHSRWERAAYSVHWDSAEHAYFFSFINPSRWLLGEGERWEYCRDERKEEEEWGKGDGGGAVWTV